MTQRNYGRRPPQYRLSLHLGNYLTGAVPAHPAAADYLAAMNGGWQMLGNDQYGDCVPVTWANLRRLVTTTLTPAKANYPSYGEVIELYKTQNPDFPYQDNGMEIQAVLEYLVKNGGPDGVKAVAFARVDHTNPDEVKAAIAIFGAVWVGINVQTHNNSEFDASQPWSWNPSDQVEGGHSVLGGGYGPPGAGALSGDERFITWAQETSFTDGFWANGVEECWVVIWPEHLGTAEFEQGITVSELAADFEAITGNPLPIPAPPAPPAPVPTPSPTPVPTPPPAPKPIPPTPDPKPDWWDDFIEWIHSLLG